MKQAINPAVATVILVVIAVLAFFILWKKAGPRTDGPSQPVDMGKIMGKDKMAPPTNKGGPMGMGAPKQP
jgi:hypothetical protein